jgi:hypothetical protein
MMALSLLRSHARQRIWIVTDRCARGQLLSLDQDSLSWMTLHHANQLWRSKTVVGSFSAFFFLAAVSFQLLAVELFQKGKGVGRARSSASAVAADNSAGGSLSVFPLAAKDFPLAAKEERNKGDQQEAAQMDKKAGHNELDGIARNSNGWRMTWVQGSAGRGRRTPEVTVHGSSWSHVTMTSVRESDLDQASSNVVSDDGSAVIQRKINNNDDNDNDNDDWRVSVLVDGVHSQMD